MREEKKILPIIVVENVIFEVLKIELHQRKYDIDSDIIFYVKLGRTICINIDFFRKANVPTTREIGLPEISVRKTFKIPKPTVVNERASYYQSITCAHVTT